MHNGIVDTPLVTHKENSLFSDTSQCLVGPRGSRCRAFTTHKNQAPGAFTVVLFSSSLTQFTNHLTLPTPKATSKAGLLKPTHPVDTQPLQTRNSACIIPFGAIRNMSGNAGTVSVNSSVTSTTSPDLQGLSQTISLGSAGPVSLVLSTPTQAPASSPVSSTTAQSGLTVPSAPQSPTPPQTPELKAMTKVTAVPALDLDQASTSSSNTTLITTSPYTQNESVNFPSGTAFWQSTSSQASSQTPPSRTSLITASPYAQNEGVTFTAGTAFWQPSTTPSAAAAASNPNTPACNVTSSAPTSQRPMSSPLPASNIIAASPYAQNEGVAFSSQTSFWTSSNANTSAFAANLSSNSAGTSMITSSPYTQNEGVTIAPGTPMWQPKQ